MKTALKKYSEAGFKFLPIQKDKTPALSKSWVGGMSADEFNGAYGVGIICGKDSGGIECIDIDNHFGDAKKNLTAYFDIPEVKAIYDKHKLPLQQTQGGGYHRLFRCQKNDGNSKLARRWNKEEKRAEALFETKGEGGYFVAEPTPGYKVIRNDMLIINEITEIERAILLNSARSFNEFIEVKKTEYESNDRPGDLYNKSFGAIEEAKGLLRQNGWSEVRGKLWRRPGKEEGVSATFGVVAPEVFYVFSSSAYPFDPERAYTPFSILALLKYGGDFSLTASNLPKPDKIIVETKGTIKADDLEKILLGSKIDISKPIDEPPTILTILEDSRTGTWNYKRLFTLGNFSVILGKAKTKKTFLVTMLASAVLGKGEFHRRFVSNMGKIGKPNVLWFDTEQGEWDSQNCIKKINRMGGDMSKVMAFSLRPYTPVERCQLIEHAFRLWGDKTGLCVKDGIADLANGINDEDEATRVSSMLLRLTKINNCHIMTVIHQNKNDNYATGHLGSAVMKKAEIIISVAKNPDDRSIADVNCDMSRGIDFEPFSFEINEGLPRVCDFIKPVNKPIYETEKENNCPF